jgi:hypothetical protein
MSATPVIVMTMGGLGNQRFQDAAVRMLALTIVRKLLLDPSAYREDRFQADHGGEGEIVSSPQQRM